MPIASKNINAEKIQGNLDITSVSASAFTGSFIGDGAGLYNLPTQSIDTGSFATTGSNIFIGSQTISGSINLGSGSVVSESGSSLILTPPTAQLGQSLVIRPTSGNMLISASGYIVAGQTLTITLISSQFSAASQEDFYYTISGSTAPQLGLGSLSGTFLLANWVDTGGNTGYNQISIPIPANSTATTLTLTINGSSLFFGGYVFTNNPITITDNGISNNEASHVHLVTGDPTTVDLYLGDDDQYVKIEKNNGNVVVGTNSNTNQWIFDTSGSLTTPGSINSPSITSSLFGTASWATNAVTASYVQTAQTASYILNAVSSSFASTASFVATAQTASYVLQAVSASYATSASRADSSSFALTSSYILQAVSSSYAATASNILGGKATHVPYFITDTTLATSSIFQSGSTSIIINQDNNTTANPEALYVWQPSTTSINVISGKGNLNNYLQLNIQNTNQGISASSDVVATANNGNETDNYIDMGINSENYNTGFIGGVNDAYIYSTGRHLHIGNVSNFPVQIFAGGSDVDIHNKLELNPNNQHMMSGSLDVSGSIKAFSFTGSLQGNATSATTSQTSSYSTTLGASLSQPANNQVRLLNSAGGTLSTVTVDNVISASHASNSTTADYAANAGNGGVTQIIAGSGITLLPAGGQGAVTVIASAGGGVTIISGSLVTGSFVNTTSYTFNHDLSTRTPIITVFDSNYNQIIPENIQLVDTASAIITFPTAESGFAIGSTGGTTGTALSSSYALFSTYADTASYFAETDPVFVAKSGSFATTGSNIFRGNQIVTGSLFTTGSNTLIGNTVLSGSLSISGSQTFNGTSAFYGNHTLSGSNTILGNTVMSGSIEVSGSSNFRNSVFIVTGSTSFKGIHQVSGSTSITGSFNVIDGDINIVSGSSFTRWGNKLFNYGQFSDTTTQSGSADTPYAMKFNTTDFVLNTRIVSSSRITVDNTGIYNLQFSAQLGNTANSTIDFDIWFAYTGSNIANSNTNVTLNKVAGSNGRLVASWNFATPIAANDYVEIYWSCNAATGQLQATGTQTAPTRPAIPSVIATLTQIA